VRAFGALGLAVVSVILTGTRPAAAHAELVSSVPASGATVTSVPTQLLATFSEPADPALSSITVVDQSGAARSGGRPHPVAGHPRQLTVPLTDLSDGLYTVTWQTIAARDGHGSTGTFTFTVQTAPMGPAGGIGLPVQTAPMGPAGGIGLPVETAPRATGSTALPAPTVPPRHTVGNRPAVPAVVARWLYYLGLIGLLGGSFVGLAIFRPPPTRLVRWALPVSWLVCLAGCLAITESQRARAGLSVSHLLSSSLGHTMMFRGAGALEVAVPIALAVIGRGLVRTAGLAAVCLTAALAMLGDVKTSHAGAAHSWAWWHIGIQWCHFLAVGIWIGGLATLLFCLPAIAVRSRAAGIRRFSSAAGIALFVVAATGALRSLDEVGSWSHLWSTGFGQLVLVKIGVIALLAGLGAVNRYANVPRAGRAIAALRRVSMVEVGLAGAALIATALLQNLAPPAASAMPARPVAVTPMDASVLQGSDANKTTAASLSVDPGARGVNHFRVTVNDYRKAAPLADARVTLRFSLAGSADYGESDLDLPATAPGVYEAGGGDLSANGTWNITVVVRRPARAAEIGLRLRASGPAMSMDTNG
jgi:copper transport protein